MEQGQGITLDEEWNTKQKSILINFLESLLDEIQDEGNRMFIHSLQEKLKKGETLNIFDQFIKNEVSYLVEEVLAKK
ncbi:hypothetical protein [Peribacillus loiseleuriae]|nr:hypothetical protein [Peribacillus loiseleuriae]